MACRVTDKLRPQWSIGRSTLSCLWSLPTKVLSPQSSLDRVRARVRVRWPLRFRAAHPFLAPRCFRPGLFRAIHGWRSPDPVGTSCFCRGGSPRVLLALKAPAAGRDRLQEKIYRSKHKPLTLEVEIEII